MDHPAPRIAVIDDEERFRVALSRLLKAHGYVVAGFAAGAEFLAAAAQQRFDCVLLDLDMPGMTGFDVLAALHGETAPPPVIVITAHDEPEFVARARALHAFDCQFKPVRAPALFGAIERALAR